MNILLLIPNSRDIYRCIPLGLLYIASVLRKEEENRLKIIDARNEQLGHKEIIKRIKDFSPEVIGISGLSMEADEIHKLAQLAKEVCPGCKVIIGGPYASSSPESVVDDLNIDFAVVGEGEQTTLKLIDALKNGGQISDIDGLAFKHNGRTVINPRHKTVEDLDSILFPSWDLIDVEGYFNSRYRSSENPIPVSSRILPVLTSRGCPYQCIYCHNIFGKSIRLRSVGSVVEEIELLVAKYNVSEIEVVDDCFNFDLKRAKGICDEIISRGIKINLSFPNGLRVDRMDEELVDKLKQAGTYMIYYAIESASPQVQKRIKKNLDLEKARRIIDYTRKQNIITCGTFMLGFPQETKEQMLQTVKFAQEAGFDIANFYYVVPYPNTVLFKELKLSDGDVRSMRPYSFLNLSFNSSCVSDGELRAIWAKAYRGFYLRFFQAWRIYRVVRRKKVLLRNAFNTLKRCGV
ncbi:B12-binding domain-containing radical SAM protein [Candidatus Omnitrophota bacterium]